MTIEERLQELGYQLPKSPQLPPGVRLPFSFVRMAGNRAVISGHSAQEPDGKVSGPFGKVGIDVTEAEAYEYAKSTALSMLGSLQRELGDLDRIEQWVKALGMVNAGPEFSDFPAVINGWSDLILEVFGEDVGQHSRSAIGVAGLPWNIPVEVEAEVIIRT